MNFWQKSQVQLCKIEMKQMSLLVFTILMDVGTSEFTEYSPQECKCGWANGSKTADCSRSNFQDIPKTLDSEIQILDLTANELYEIRKHDFKKVGLINLKKLILKGNKLRRIHKSGLSGLELMIELDLSNNELKYLHVDLFRETSKIKNLFLSGNQIEKLEDGLFSNLPFLQKLDLSDNKIVTLGSKAFSNVPSLTILRLDSNKLKNMQFDTFKALSALSLLYLHNNPWSCNCDLLPVINWIITNDLQASPIACSEPPELSGKSWQELNSIDFNCQPSITYPSEKTTIRPSDTDTKLSCPVNFNNLPEANWVLNTQIKDGVYSYQGEVNYYEAESTSENKWVNLTINLCIVKNLEGDNGQQLTLAIAPLTPGVIVH